MRRVFQLLRRGLAGGAQGVGTVVLWSVWLVLGIALVVQTYIATTSELAVPRFALQQAEQRLAEAGLKAAFKRTAFDPSGRILIEDVELAPIGYSDPVLKARMIYIETNPWMLVVGRFEPRQIRVTGASVSVPAMISGSGAPVELVRDLDLTLRPAPRALLVDQFIARVANVVLTARGTVPLPRPQTPSARPALAEFFEQRFPGYCRQALAAAAKLDALQSPALHLDLAPAESGALSFGVTFTAAALALETPLASGKSVATQARDLRVETRVLMLGATPTLSRVQASVAEAHVSLTGDVPPALSGGVQVRGVKAEAFGRLAGGQFEPRSLELAVESAAAAGVDAHALSVALFPRPLPRLEAEIAGIVAGSPLSVQAEADLTAQTATLAFRSNVSPQVLDVISARAKVDVRRSFDFDHAEIVRGTARFGAKWKFEGLEARVILGEIRARGVTFNEGRTTITFDGKRFFAPEAYGRVGANYARGSYEHELGTHRYRFLLLGRLRPLDISPWFQDWWPNFFRDFSFPEVPPEAGVDVTGRWREGRQTSVYIYAHAPAPVIRGVAFEHVHTRLFVRPSYFEGLDVRAKRGDAALRGTFAFQTDPGGSGWRSFDLAADSSFDLPTLRTMIGPASDKILAPFALANAPEVKVEGHFDGPAAPNGRHYTMKLLAETAGEFRFFHFPLQDVSFEALIKDDDITVDNVALRFAGGTSKGKARVWGSSEARRLGFDFSLKDASLGLTAASFQDFIAHHRNRPPAPPGKFIQEKANVRIELAASAEGGLSDPLSFHGDGNAALTGAEIGEVPLLGGLSDILKFTTLRFTSARANFKIDGPKLAFSEVAVRGSNSAIDAHGDYLLDRRELDFYAKILPFHESANILKTIMGAVLTPLSNVFEVKLTGSFEKPAWSLALGSGGSAKPAGETRETDKPAASAAAPGTAPAAPSGPATGEPPARPPTT